MSNNVLETLEKIPVQEFRNELATLRLGAHSQDAKYMAVGPLRFCQSFIVNEPTLHAAKDVEHNLRAVPRLHNLLKNLNALKRLGRCYYTKLAPGYDIRQHVDSGVYFDRINRFHLYLDTLGTNSHILLNGIDYRPRAGDFIRFPLGVNHSYSVADQDNSLSFIVVDLYKENA
jgi:hypothetical protein